MKLLTYLLYTLLITAFFSCGNPHKKKKGEWKKHKSELRMKYDTISNDSVRKARMKKWKEKKQHKNDSIT